MVSKRLPQHWVTGLLGMLGSWMEKPYGWRFLNHDKPVYPLVNVYITDGKITMLLMGKLTINGNVK
jgi:hypothetical protein